MTLRPSTTPQRVPLPSPPASSLPDGPDPESDSLRAASPTVTRFLATAVTDPLFESSAPSALVAQLVDFAAACLLTTPLVLLLSPRLRLCVLRPSGWQAAMDAKMASWKSTGTYVDEVSPPGTNIGVDFFHTFSPTPKMTTLRVLLHVDAQCDYELHSLDFSTAFLHGSLHQEIWLRRPPGLIGSFPAGTQWSLQRPVYGLRQAPRKWHDTLTTTLSTLGFAPSTAEPSPFLRTDTTLSSFYVLVYVDDLVFATADTEALAHVNSELQKRHTCTDLGELTSYLGLRITRDRAQRTITLTQSHMVQQVLQRFGFTYSSPQSTPQPTGYSLSAPPSDDSVEPSGPYPELVGCLIGRRRVTPSVLAPALSLGGLLARLLFSALVFYVGAMAAQELRWLTYLLTDLGEAPRSPPVLYVDNKAMLALSEEHRLEHRTKHIALRYFLAQELQQRGQLCLAYVASQANIADVFTKALPPCDHQRFCTVLGLVPTMPHLLTLRGDFVIHPELALPFLIGLVLLHVATQCDYELHSPDFSTAFLQGSLYEEIWLRRPPGFTGTFPAGTQWSLHRPFYGLCHEPREWHDTLRTTLAALGFSPSTTDPSLFLRTDTSLPWFYVLVYVDDLVFATADTEALTLVKSKRQKRHTCTNLDELRSYLGLLITRDRARRTITLTQSHMVHQVLQHFDFQFSSP
ncbi:unnamed protein product [Closterium sp. NIES-54]